MSIIAEIIRTEENGSISFGNYEAREKQKVSDFDVSGDIYKIKTHNEVTRLEKNAKLLLETVPGATVQEFTLDEKRARFFLTGFDSTQVTMELLPESDYRILVDGVDIGHTKSGKSGKLSFSVELNENPQKIKIEKV
ncbi:MAG: endosialidase [Clostridiales bacterium]|jgi:hypothetical protein|nr:endosialidase [Clostridiales bacterium]